MLYVGTELRTSTHTAFGFALNAQRNYEDDFSILEYLIEKCADINAPCIINKLPSNKQYIGYSSILAWAIDTKLPSYIIEWLQEQGVKVIRITRV